VSIRHSFSVKLESPKDVQVCNHSRERFQLPQTRVILVNGELNWLFCAMSLYHSRSINLLSSVQTSSVYTDCRTWVGNTPALCSGDPGLKSQPKCRLSWPICQHFPQYLLCKFRNVYELWGSHGDKAIGRGVQVVATCGPSCRLLPTFRRSVSPACGGWLYHDHFLVVFHFISYSPIVSLFCDI
jgi:hypothetical protein